MSASTRPYVLDLTLKGFIEGITQISPEGEDLCHYFGGLPYGLPPVGPYRFRRPRPLPPCYRYGTRANPGKFTGGTAVCPQPTAAKTERAQEIREEDCLQLNVHLPIGKPPAKGWPVLFYLHGGFLQFGSPNDQDASKLLSETDFQCIIVMPAYRLNVFGFLASRELLRESGAGCEVGNLGFWDQRLALEWTWKNISYFGGDAGNITVAGYSAGSYSVFMQLQYDLFLPDRKSIIRRAIMWSNGPGVQPKSLPEAQDQFDELLQALDISLDLPASEKLAKLRQLTPDELVDAPWGMELHQFRAVTDGEFVRPELFEDIDNGEFASRMKRRGVKLMIGENKDEHWVYGTWRTPEDDLDSLCRRLEADYPRKACQALVAYYYPNGQLPNHCDDWCQAFGYIYADVQIHNMERGFVNALDRTGAGDLIYRYRVEWRAKCVDGVLPKEWGVTHTSDLAIWFWGGLWGPWAKLDKDEKRIAYESFVRPFIQYVKGEDVEWGTKSIREVRTLTPEGTVQIREDADWARGQGVWQCLQEVGATAAAPKGRL